MAIKSFHIGDILSVSTGTLVSQDGMEGVYNILNWMTQDDLFTHQILLASPIMREELKRQWPFLNGVEKPVGLEGRAQCDAWVASVSVEVGEWFDIRSAEHLWQDHSVMGDLASILLEGKKRG